MGKLSPKCLPAHIRVHIVAIILLSLGGAAATLAGLFALERALPLLAVAANLQMSALVVALLAIRRQTMLAVRT